MRIEQISDFLGRRFRQSRHFRFQLAQLLQRDCDGFGEPIAFGFDFTVGDLRLDDRKIAAFRDMSRPDGNPR